MKKSILFVMISLVCFLKIKAQNTPETALHINSFYGGNTATIDSSSYGTATPGINYGCLITGRYAWVMVPVCDSSSAEITFSGFGTSDTTGYAVFGPFQDTVNIISHLSTTTPIVCKPYQQTFGLHQFNISGHGRGLYYIAFTFVNDTISHIVNQYPGSAIHYCTFCENANFIDQRICLISLDSTTQRNKIIFDKGDTSNIAGHVIYRENSIANQFDSLTFIDVDSANYFIDMTANPSSRYWRYKMLRYDKCGNSLPSTAFSSYLNWATTLFLQQAIGTNNSINLAWNNSGNIFPFPGTGPFMQSFFIYRRNNGGQFQILDSVPSFSTGYTDVSPLSGLNEYQVSMRQSATCSIVNKTAAGYSESLSNIISTTFTGLDEPVNHHFFDVFPNPASAETTINIMASVKSFSLSVIAADGRNVFRKDGLVGGKTKIDTGNLSKGFYMVKLSADGKDYYRRLIIN